MQANTTLNNSSLFVIIIVVAFALSSHLESRDNDVVQKVKRDHSVDPSKNVVSRSGQEMND